MPPPGTIGGRSPRLSAEELVEVIREAEDGAVSMELCEPVPAAGMPLLSEDIFFFGKKVFRFCWINHLKTTLIKKKKKRELTADNPGGEETEGCNQKAIGLHRSQGHLRLLVVLLEEPCLLKVDELGEDGLQGSSVVAQDLFGLTTSRQNVSQDSPLKHYNLALS
jgi:hypothetical protein